MGTYRGGRYSNGRYRFVPVLMSGELLPDPSGGRIRRNITPSPRLGEHRTGRPESLSGLSILVTLAPWYCVVIVLIAHERDQLLVTSMDFFAEV